VARLREFYRHDEAQVTLLPTDLNTLVLQVAELTRARWSDMPQKRGVVIRMVSELAPDLPVVQGAENEIREALINLVFNAVDAMPDGGTLTLRTAPNPGDMWAPPSAHVDVIDTGVGMDDATRQRCLEPFFTTKGERGTGLGLAMVYGIAQRHGADVHIDSAVGRGTTVRMSFPVSPVASVTSPEASASHALTSPRRILIVDDDPIVLRSLRDTLEADGHAVTAVDGGQAGIDAFRAARDLGEAFDVVITDLGMPYVDGRQVASAVKQAAAATPVILLTGWGQRLAAEGEVPAHVDRVLGKPPKLRELRAALGQLVGEAGNGRGT
jgi:CheY-like chemotaxis protein